MALLREYGPTLGRPRAETLNGSKHANMKELRFRAADRAWRVTYAFDPKREGVLLMAGDKSGGSGRRFYKQLISKSDTRYDAHLATLKKEYEADYGKSYEELMAELSPERRERVNVRAAELIAEEKSLRYLRQARQLTQQRMAKRLGVRQHSISRLEPRSDMLLSTLRDYVAKMGGELVLTAQFPDRGPVRIKGFANIAGGAKRRSSVAAATRTAARGKRPSQRAQRAHR